jgi:Catalase
MRTSKPLLASSVFVLTISACKTARQGSDEKASVNVIVAHVDTSVIDEIDSSLGEEAVEKEIDLSKEIAETIAKSILKDYPPGSGLTAKRDAHPKAHGCVEATFKVSSSLDARYAYGAFVPGKSYKSWIRFSNGDSDSTRPDSKGDARGMAIKLMGVPGDKLLPAEKNEQTQDFIMINHPVFIIDSPSSYLSLIKKVNSTNPLVKLTIPLTLGFEGSSIARAMTAKVISNPLTTRFWSMTPYRLGDDGHKQAIKFSAIPCGGQINGSIPNNPSDNYLREAMKATLDKQDACFKFFIQPRTSPDQLVEKSTQEWTENQSPFIEVATITIPKQNFDTAAQHQFCENLSFTPWHALPEHRPLGSVNRVRRVVYETISRLRHDLNKAERKEPN